MNQTIQYWSTVQASSGNTVAANMDRFRVPDGFCMRLRAVEFRAQVILEAGDSRVHMGLSRLVRDPGNLTETPFVEYQKFLAYWSMENELTSSGMASFRLDHKVELWDYDYRLAIKPTLLVNSNGFSNFISIGVHGELVPCSEGQRNAIISWQGGP